MESVDVVIVGAGLSGIGTAVHLQRECPGKSFALLEARNAIGGTWDLYRYPGIRSDSDMHTLGYNFKPWRASKAIADGPSILAYVRETADENGIRKHIRFQRRLDAAAWSSADAQWTLDVAHTSGDARTEQIRCKFLLICSGYYSYDEPYRPPIDGEDEFEGPLFHPQFWPEDLDVSDKRVVVIGSGATAMTIVPAIAKDVGHVTMLQRSPTYVISLPSEDGIANKLRKFLPEMWAYKLTRFKNTELQRRMYEKTRRNPEKAKEFFLSRTRRRLGDAYVEKHFTPRYNPWDQRLCLIPDGDLYDAIESGKASVVTAQIDRITKKGIRLQSGEELDADIIVVATGLNLKWLGGAQFRVDGDPIHFPDTFTYKGMMYSDVPNLVHTFGYINASWTLRADLTAEYACRVLNHMDALGVRQVTPRLREEDRGMATYPWIRDFSSGYIQRGLHRCPKQGDRMPWLNTQRYARDKKIVRRAPLEDGVLTFDNPASPPGTRSVRA